MGSGCELVSGIAELEVEVEAEAGQMDGQNQQVFLFAAESRGPGGMTSAGRKEGNRGGGGGGGVGRRPLQLCCGCLAS